jgi:two-component system, chemotaxis family, response regulator Rcp1
MNHASLASGKTLEILLAEDNLADAHMAIEIFRKCRTPLKITRVKNGEEALHHLQEAIHGKNATLPDLILLDINMPRKNGLDVLKEIRLHPATSNIPTLMLTCSETDADKHQAYESNANFYMVKPMDVSGFHELVKYVENVWLKGL